MRLLEIIKQPTCVSEIPTDCVGVHESTLRAYQILQLVKRYLANEVPPTIVLEIIQELESAPGA